MGSLVTNKAIPKDADVLVTIKGTMDLGELARWSAPQGVCSSHQPRRRIEVLRVIADHRVEQANIIEGTAETAPDGCS
jgi:hypothetical protein